MNKTRSLIENKTDLNPAFLHHLKKDDWGVEVGEFMSLGRDPSCTWVLSDPTISSKHARIEKKELGYLLRDLRSRNGTYLNGTKVIEAYLHEGDRIQIGQTHFEFSHKRSPHDKIFPLQSKNKKWAETLDHLTGLAESDLPVLILGPSGSGKELLAESLHRNSPRRSSPLISVNCSALSHALIESELFGHTKGSFTGATEDRKGAFEAARGGTLFLDEVGDLPLSLQPKLLRALENNEIRPVGSDESIKTDVRIVAATHHDLREKVLQGDFRLDLYYRLNVLQIKAPSLKERMEDFESLLMQFCKEFKVSFSPALLPILKKHGWPGNIRELKNFVAKARAYYNGNQISSPKQIYCLLDEPSVPKAREKDLTVVEPSRFNKSLLKELEYELIKKRLIANNGNQRQTALDLGIPKSTLHDRIKAYKIKV